jgi:hypothetical protein
VLLAVQTINKDVVTGVPGCTMKAYWGEEVLLHMLTSNISRGEQPARRQLLCLQENASSSHQTAGWLSLSARSWIKQQFCVFVRPWETAVSGNCKRGGIIGVTGGDGNGWLRAVCGDVYILHCTEGTLQCVGMCTFCSVQRVPYSVWGCVHTALYRGYITVCGNVYILQCTEGTLQCVGMCTYCSVQRVT